MISVGRRPPRGRSAPSRPTPESRSRRRPWRCARRPRRPRPDRAATGCGRKAAAELTVEVGRGHERDHSGSDRCDTRMERVYRTRRRPNKENRRRSDGSARRARRHSEVSAQIPRSLFELELDGLRTQVVSFAAILDHEDRPGSWWGCLVSLSGHVRGQRPIADPAPPAVLWITHQGGLVTDRRLARQQCLGSFSRCVRVDHRSPSLRRQRAPVCVGRPRCGPTRGPSLARDLRALGEGDRRPARRRTTRGERAAPQNTSSLGDTLVRRAGLLSRVVGTSPASGQRERDQPC